MVFKHPFRERPHRTQKLPAEIGERVFDLGWIGGRHGPGNEAVFLEVPQGARQYLLADLADLPAQRVEAAGPAPEHAHDQNRPFVGDPCQHAANQDALLGFRGGYLVSAKCLLVKSYELIVTWFPLETNHKLAEIMTQTRLPTYFLSHGGGPWPWLKDERGAMYDQLEASLKETRRELGQAPAAVLMISGHWEADRFLLSSAAHPPMVFDYSGFPEHTYHIRYDAPGAPALAETVRAMLERGGVASGLDPQRGYDHGTFTLMHTMYPKADMPVVQLSINANYDPAAHIKVGELLAPLRDQGVLIVGSGFSFHNLRTMRSGAGPRRRRRSTDGSTIRW